MCLISDYCFINSTSMPTEFKLNVFIPGITAKDYHRIVYADGALITHFHLETNGDSSATATPWIDGKRSVTFRMPLNVPAMLKKLIGADSIKVVEECNLVWLNASCFQVKSEPCLDFPGASKFSSSGVTTVSDTEGGCQVECVMRCSAAMPWPMQGTVEAAMVQEGKVTVGKYLDFTVQACQEERNNRAASVASRANGPAAEDPEGEAFFDAEDLISSVYVRAQDERHEDQVSNVHGQNPSRSLQQRELVIHEELGRGEVALRCLLQIQSLCSEMCAILKQMQQSQQHISHSVSAMGDVLCSNGSKKRSHAPSNSICNRTGPAMLYFCIAGASVVSILYLRSRLQGLTR
ncbi:hypothetical protein CEUSTIGMA_g7451.t1 [Chlamydomonas eustigma]|uniref:VASt domain-containing protein n=1 Tax=Chlamydomonas eustigma TaxID=1157962 RepID=A0A250XAW5_9CHLO|nr:hypothetical protein CEUSTIGMA_g7451.t1 [Chlamydomonas eustigma]|eukprot:GAX80012.1 hypothetical protein CEUSTIGMA_g7451.t1 [Chlamydomonas eustigma]